jgi:hypothetical protein
MFFQEPSCQLLIVENKKRKRKERVKVSKITLYNIFSKKNNTQNCLYIGRVVCAVHV